VLLTVATAASAFAPVTGMQIMGRASSSRLWAISKSSYEYALLFDCDGVILETEELHRLAYNKAFKEFSLSIDGKPVEWSVRTMLLFYWTLA